MRVVIGLAVLALVATPLAGCANLAAGAANVVATVNGPLPTQAHTLAEAVQAATLVTKGADVAVNTGKLNRADLLKINALSDGVHAALTDLETANAHNQALNFAAFNAALDAYNAYMTSSPVPN